jgi:hypothetical protein
MAALAEPIVRLPGEAVSILPEVRPSPFTEVAVSDPPVIAAPL